MSEHRPSVPGLDEQVSAEQLHSRCEQVAVPDFDWFNEPIIAVVDGLAHVRHHADPTAGDVSRKKD